jgi:uncharacterized protein YndB with AHSA1/START domain
VFLEASGRFFERDENGREVDMGRVLSWDPPHRLTLDFYIGTSAAQPTFVEVTFAEEDGGTRVLVLHQPGANGELWDQRAPVFERSWETVLGTLANW